MSYKELLSSVRCKCIIIIEDDFKQGEYKKERVMYDIVRMALVDREQYLDEVDRISSTLKEVLSKYLSLFDSCFDMIGNWEESIPRGDITCAFPLIETLDPALKECIENQYVLFAGEDVQRVYDAGAKFGIGVDHPAYFDTLYNEYVLNNNRAFSLRIYTDFSAETQRLLITDIASASREESVVCIIDNHLNGVNRAQEIIQVISAQCHTGRRNIIGSVFSSKERFEEINDKLYFEYTPKEHPEQLKSCIAKSAYNYFISELKSETISGLGEAFDTALKNKGIAFFLAHKAQIEGTSEYEIINDWIKLLATTAHKNSSAIKRMICLSRVINSLDDSGELPDTSLQQLNTFEAFDYTVNDYHLPVSSGDIFTNSRDEWYVLIGQDCDMARSTKRKPQNALAELLPAKVRHQTEFGKWANDLRSASIYSFSKDQAAESGVLQVEYQKRKYLANEIINLAAFNLDGQCHISLSEPLSDEQMSLMPNYMVGYYAKLQDYFSSVQSLRIQSEEAFNAVIADEYSPRLLSLNQFTLDSDPITFDLKRVCRLTHSYVFYLYKLYLEYRGRQPFQTINLIRQEDTTLPVLFEKQPTELFLSFCSIPIPDKSNRKDWCWVIDRLEIDRILEALGQPKTLGKDMTVLICNSTVEVLLAQGKKLHIEKAKDKVLLEIK